MARRFRLSLVSALLVPVAAAALIPAGAGADGPGPQGGGPAAGPGPGTRTTKVEMAFFEQWGIYGRSFDLSTADSEGEIADLTDLDYAFGGVKPQNPGAPIQENPSQANYNPVVCTSVDTWADYQTPYLNPVTGANGQPEPNVDPTTGLAGNLEQLKELKAKYPRLKVIMSLGGYTGSGSFSAAASSDAARQAFVKSCVDEFILGNLPGLSSGAGAGIFDGFDIDWEYPCANGINNGAAGNICNYQGANDTQDLVALLREFRTQLDALSREAQEQYTLTVEVPAGVQNAQNEDPAGMARYVNDEVIMDYDFQGPWEPNGPTNFESNLYTSPNAPTANGEPVISVASTVQYYERHGAPARQLVVGMPYYGHGWTGVAPGTDVGLYQYATGPAASPDINSAGQSVPGLDGSVPSGTSDYYELANMPGFSWHFDPATGASWLYNPATHAFWSIENPVEVYEKAQYIDSQGLAGASVWALEGDSGNSLTSALTLGLEKAPPGPGR